MTNVVFLDDHRPAAEAMAPAAPHVLVATLRNLCGDLDRAECFEAAQYVRAAVDSIRCRSVLTALQAGGRRRAAWAGSNVIDVACFDDLMPMAESRDPVDPQAVAAALRYIRPDLDAAGFTDEGLFIKAAVASLDDLNS